MVDLPYATKTLSHIKIIPYTSLKSVGKISISLKFKMAAKMCKKKDSIDLSHSYV